MLRFILKNTYSCELTGDSGEILKTIDIDLPLLEEELKKGGFGENGFDKTELIGVEIKTIE